MMTDDPRTFLAYDIVSPTSFASYLTFGLVLFIKITDPMMIPVASQMRGSNTSFASQTPSSTATIGLT
jgi:hypothetical protein